MLTRVGEQLTEGLDMSDIPAKAGSPRGTRPIRDDELALRPLLGVVEVAMILGVPKATLYRWHSVSTSSTQVGPRAFRVGRYLRYSLDDLRAYINELRGSAS